MTDPANNAPKHKELKQKPAHTHFVHKIDASAVLTVIGVILLFSTSIIVTLVAPRYVDSTWTSPSSPYQVQMYEVEDPNLYISSTSTRGTDLQYVHHLKQDFTLLAFKESENLRLVAPKELDKFVTREQDKQLKLTSRLLMLRLPEGDMQAEAENLRQELQNEWQAKHPPQRAIEKVNYQILELYDPQVKEAFSFSPSSGILQNWVDQDFVILDEGIKHPFHQDYGVVYIQNPREFRLSTVRFGGEEHWRYDPDGRPILNLDELESPAFGFFSRKGAHQFR